MDPDPDPAIFVIDLQDASKKLIFNTIFSAYYFLKVHLHYLSKIKRKKESQNRRNQGFSYYFCMRMEGSGAGSGAVSIPLTSGSGSGRPKNIWIRWIQIRLRNTAKMLTKKFYFSSSDPDTTFHPDADPDPDPSFQKNAQTRNRIHKQKKTMDL
jgi:hypothetical protein